PEKPGTTKIGSMTIHVPENAAYTLPETIDLLNEALLDQNYILIQRERTFTLVPADQKVRPELVQDVTVEELANRGKTEIVRITVRLKSLVAEDVQGQVKRMLSPFGEVVGFPTSNALVLTDTVAALQQVLKTIREDEDHEGS